MRAFFFFEFSKITYKALNFVVKVLRSLLFVEGFFFHS